LDFKVEYTDDIFICTSSGIADAGAVVDLIDTMLSHANWKPGTPRCYDISNMETGSLTVDDIRRIAGFGGDRKDETGGGRVAVVVSRDLEFGLARMLTVYLSNLVESDYRVFRSRDEALDWLAA